MIWSLLLAFDCADGPGPPPPEEQDPAHLLELEEARLEGDGLHLVAARATIDDPRVVHAATVEVTATADGAPPLEIEAPRSEWDLASRRVLFEGGVTATRGEVVLTADRLSVQMADARRVDRAEVEGNVLMTRGERRAGSARATLTAATGELVMEGEPWISEGANRMTGQRITVWLDSDRVVCEACRLVVEGEALGVR